MIFTHFSGQQSYLPQLNFIHIFHLKFLSIFFRFFLLRSVLFATFHRDHLTCVRDQCYNILTSMPIFFIKFKLTLHHAVRFHFFSFFFLQIRGVELTMTTRTRYNVYILQVFFKLKYIFSNIN